MKCEHEKYRIVVRRAHIEVAEWCPKCGAFRLCAEDKEHWTPWFIPELTKEKTS